MLLGAVVSGARMGPAWGPHGAVVMQCVCLLECLNSILSWTGPMTTPSIFTSTNSWDNLCFSFAPLLFNPSFHSQLFPVAVLDEFFAGLLISSVFEVLGVWIRCWRRFKVTK